ncbi:MAG: formate--phosphoribosylaminoimidazolecarboxamide ligase family protein [Candidatus Bathyarchaeia archaeon]|jgi:5-formaminoimidazole-4-carboxamide-1-(beta)-D-ribofuranosyl 5'-monophosphate synthetase|nr:formate--phosphoribosylaminoimidazolecarboxamide ligase family protein [Candidatus Bathyarchaeota archaeon A05DMB-4]MDH7595491.1 formate--phosphoribosylaminoimidazolecarboxamide ligase family protein [Candidatus Bathyarchaeota archaeon]
MSTEKIKETISKYNKNKICIGVLGSHSALEIAHGAKQEGFPTVVVCQKGREKTYVKYYKNLFDYVLLLDNFADVVKEENLQKLKKLNTIFVPNRSFSVYVGYKNIEEKFSIPIHGNRYMLKTEERNTPKNQYYLLKKAGIPTPKTFRSPDEIDRLVIVKVPEKGRKIERAFFYASSSEEFKQKAKQRIKKGIIRQADLEEAVIEEYVIGAKFNANYFWSPLTNELDLLGFDKRIQTDLDGVLDLPANEQLELATPTQNVEIGHIGVTMRESQIEKILETGEQFVKTCKKEYPPGMIGLFALQGAVTKELEFYVFDVSPRVPGCPCVEPTSPYMKYKYGMEVGPGRRVAMEIKRGIKEDRLEEIMT